MEVNFEKEGPIRPSQEEQTGCATPKNCGFRGRIPTSFGKKSNLGIGNDDESEKESWQENREGCVFCTAGVWIDSGRGAAGGSARPGGACPGKAAAEDFGAADGKGGARIGG